LFSLSHTLTLTRHGRTSKPVQISSSVPPPGSMRLISSTCMSKSPGSEKVGLPSFLFFLLFFLFLLNCPADGCGCGCGAPKVSCCSPRAILKVLTTSSTSSLPRTPRTCPPLSGRYSSSFCFGHSKKEDEEERALTTQLYLQACILFNQKDYKNALTNYQKGLQSCSLFCFVLPLNS